MRTLVVVTGASCAGKTTLATALGDGLSLPVVHRDVLKEALFDTLGGRFASVWVMGVSVLCSRWRRFIGHSPRSERKPACISQETARANARAAGVDPDHAVVVAAGLAGLVALGLGHHPDVRRPALGLVLVEDHDLVVARGQAYGVGDDRDIAVAFTCRTGCESQVGTDSTRIHKRNNRLTETGIASGGKLGIGNHVAHCGFARGIGCAGQGFRDAADNTVGNRFDQQFVIIDNLLDARIRRDGRVSPVDGNVQCGNVQYILGSTIY